MYEARKELFVRRLGQLLALTREGVVEAEYEKSYDFEDKKEFAEFVVVRFNGGSEKRINVTCDSNIGIMRDVLKAI